jgi:hypothetical protein
VNRAYCVRRSAPAQIFKSWRGSDTNFAPLILRNGSMIAMWRLWNANGSRMFLATAEDWKDPDGID